jgi:RNA polymerase sigma-70 factor (ECF subfamily)
MDTSYQPDEALSQRLRDLDQAAWTTLFNEHHGKIWRYVFARTGDRDLADDITSQVFVEALESIHRFRYRGRPILAWLYRIARNHLGKRLRSAKREVASSTAEPSVNPIDAALDSIVLSDALASLTQDQADAVVLRFYSGYSTREIAAAMGKSESAVYSLEIRAIASLRRHLQDRREDS